MLLPYALYRMQIHVYLLPGAQLREDDARVCRRGRRVAQDLQLRLLALRLPHEVARGDRRVVVQHVRVRRARRRVLIACARNLQAEDERVAVRGRAARWRRRAKVSAG